MMCAHCKESHTFVGNIVNFAVGVDKLFVLTDTQLHQTRLDLNPETRKVISNATTSNQIEILLPFISNSTVITCGTYNNGYCEVLDINNISKTIHKEGINIGTYPNIAVIIGHGDNKYLLVGRKFKSSDNALVTLRDTRDKELHGGIFSKTDGSARPILTSGIQNIRATEVEFVDGFQHNASSHVCLFFNEKRGSKSTVKVLSLDSKYIKDGKYTKAGTFTTLQGAVLQCCESDVGRQWNLLSSALIPGELPILWAGVFQVETNPGETVVAVFDISRARTAPVSGFCINKGDACDPSDEVKSNQITDKVIRPAAVVFRNSSITSVAALKSNSWTVLFFGTKAGLLIKVALDESLKLGCPTVLYSSEEDRRFLPKMLFAPVNPTDVFVAQGNQMIKVPVARCGLYQTLGECWSALDPFCGWCVSQSRCRFQHDCSSSDWVSVPGTSQQRDIMSVHMVRSRTTKDITVTAAPNLNRGIRFSCALEKCDSPGPSNCSCSFSSESFPAEGLSLRVTITVQTETLTKNVLLKNCSSIRGMPTSTLCMECMSAGCAWSISGDTCTWRTASTKASETSQDICKNITLGQNYTKPEILSMSPDEVSIHGRNRAVIKGRNLESVTKVRFQGNMDCNPKESPVLSHSRNSSFHESLTFHIPSRAVKDTVGVCLLKADGQCHGNVKLTYDSPPICNHLEPKTTWASGGREIMFNGSNLKFVEKMKHKDQPEEFTLKRKKEMLVYFTPAGVLDSTGSRQVSVELLVGNSSVTCREELTYLPDPQFTSFTATRMGDGMFVIIEKNADCLELKDSEIQVQAMQGEVPYHCVIHRIKEGNDITSVVCDIENQPNISIDSLKITVGKFSFNLEKSWNLNQREAENPSLYGSTGMSLEERCKLLTFKPDVRPVRVCVLPPDAHSYDNTKLAVSNAASTKILPYVAMSLYSILGVLALMCYFHMKKEREDEAAETSNQETTKPALMYYFMKQKRGDEAAETAAPHSRETTKSACVLSDAQNSSYVHEDEKRPISVASLRESIVEDYEDVIADDNETSLDDMLTESLREERQEDYDDITTDENAPNVTKVEETKHANEKEQEYYDDITNEDDLQMTSAIAGMMTADQAQEYDDVITVTMEMILRVVVDSGDIRKVTLSNKPVSVQELIHQLEKSLRLEYAFSLQYEDPDFSNALCNLTDIRALPERPTLKIIPIHSPFCSH
ncbi:plexin-C1-like [Sardina pilchardus]|uniref:plexin-C1-like n=1 Tax=Sardina pilchardus TaxID=27697 RepID=UPI002E15408D